jgi:hypothetical protein
MLTFFLWLGNDMHQKENALKHLWHSVSLFVVPEESTNIVRLQQYIFHLGSKATATFPSYLKVEMRHETAETRKAVASEVAEEV